MVCRLRKSSSVAATQDKEACPAAGASQSQGWLSPAGRIGKIKITRNERVGLFIALRYFRGYGEGVGFGTTYAYENKDLAKLHMPRFFCVAIWMVAFSISADM